MTDVSSTAPGRAVSQRATALVNTVVLTRYARHVIVFCATTCWLTPLAGLLINSFRTTADAKTTGFWTAFLHPNLTIENYTEAFEVMGGVPMLFGTFLLAIPATMLTVSVSAVAAYGLSRMHLVGRDVSVAALIALIAIPFQVTIVPLLTFFRAVGIQGTMPAVWIVLAGLTVPYGVLLIRGVMVSYPNEIVEAARLDGASEFRIFWQLVVPDAAPIIASLAILQFIWSWNSMLEPLIFLGPDAEYTPITVALVGLNNQFGVGINLLTAGAFISLIVPLLVFISLQRYFVAGVTGSGVK